jgi:hypothetical protein
VQKIINCKTYKDKVAAIDGMIEMFGRNASVKRPGFGRGGAPGAGRGQGLPGGGKGAPNTGGNPPADTTVKATGLAP